MTILYSNILEEGESVTVSPSIIYIASNNASIHFQQDATKLLQEGTLFNLKEEATISVATGSYIKYFTIICNENWDETIYFNFIDPLKAGPELESMMTLQSSTKFSDRCKFQVKVWSFLEKATDTQQIDMDHSITYIENHIHESLTIKDLAEKVNMTSTSYARAFKKKTGKSPKDYLVERKIKKAKELIVQNKGIVMKDVANMIGIQDEFYFSRLFKKKEGVAPSIFVKRMENRIALVSQLFLQDHLLALGLQPIVAPMYPTFYPTTNGVPSYLEKQLEGTLLINAEKKIDTKRVLNLQPDKIIKTPLHMAEEQSFSWTQRQNVHCIGFQPSWKDYLKEVAALVGKEQSLQAIFDEMSMLEENAKNILKPYANDGNWAVLWVRNKEIRLYGQQKHACMELLYEGLNFIPCPNIPRSGYKKVSLAELKELNPENILFLWSTKTEVDRIASDKKWKELQAVQHNKVYLPDSKEWDPWGPKGRKHMIEELTNYLCNFQ
ncbi:HTH-type transcriptional activator Btr [Bacillus sp. THAF10]|uniref:AraC family transcriptional regulator n=1 Tax=Bacillus sp. THAF10 TaxID=2587848 RepID=UPI00126823FF|nr:AraC family transcriptional regulator [Bacillus sp. THAF10]QFT89107.1 HTH-type transcriptional activator Btr [Bacillus sp. THAF10]